MNGLSVALNNFRFAHSRTAREKRARDNFNRHHARTSVYAKAADIVADPLRTRRIVAAYQERVSTRVERVRQYAEKTVMASFKAHEAQNKVKGLADARVGSFTLLNPDLAGAQFEAWINTTFMSVLLDAELSATAPGPGTFLVGINAQVIGVAAVQAYEKARAAGLPVALELEDFVRNVRSVNPADIAATRQFGLLRNMSFATGDAVRDELVAGLKAGHGAETIAQAISKKVKGIGLVRARTIARTEVTYTHAEATLNALGLSGATHVEPLVEFSLNVHGSADPCPICVDLSGKIYTVDNAKGVIPVHANCQCGWTPVGIGRA